MKAQCQGFHVKDFIKDRKYTKGQGHMAATVLHTEGICNKQ